jgi:hypothetical protein
MDFATFLTDELNQHEGVIMTPQDTARMLARAAHQTVQYAAAGHHVIDTMTMEQLGLVLAALQWNINPAIRQAVKVRKNG